MLLKVRDTRETPATIHPANPSELLSYLVDNAGDAIEVLDAETLDYVDVMTQ